MQIDLSGPDGNAFALLGLAKRLAKELGIDNVDSIIEEMQSGDYESLLKVFEKHFGEYVEFL